MLKLLKWVYNLGYKHAEMEYYHALRGRVQALRPRAYEYRNALVRSNEENGDKYKNDLARREVYSDDLLSMVNEVFHLPKSVEEALKNRFGL